MTIIRINHNLVALLDGVTRDSNATFWRVYR
jgi:hypothetical protein